MSLLVFEHHPDETPAVLGSILQSYGHRLRVVELDEGDAVPVDLDDVDGIVSMGGPMNVDEVGRHPWLEPEMAYLNTAHQAGVPIVGVCLGAQLVAKALGGDVAPMKEPEVGWQNVRLAFGGTIDPIYTGIGWDTMQFHTHSRQVTQLPPDATPLAGSKMCRCQAFRVTLTTYAFQYHFEWDIQALMRVATDGLVKEAGTSADQIIADCRTYYDDYRRLGDRLCHTIATVLFPIVKT